MSPKRLNKDQKYFLLLGVPSLTFTVYILLTFYILFTFFFLVVFIVLCLGLMNRKNAYRRATKIGLLMVAIFVVNHYNPVHWSSQLATHFPGGRQHLIDPDHPEIAEIEEELYQWHRKVYNCSFKDLPEEERDDLDLKMKRLDRFIRTEIMEYTPDSEAPYFTSDYIASLDEIFQSDTDEDGLYQDDCDGITLVTVSLLLHMGYNAYIAECLSHWNSIVFPEGANPKTEEGFEQGVHLYNWWGRPSYYIFNETEVIIPPGRPVTLSFSELFLDESTYTDEYLGFFRGHYLDLPLVLLVLLAYLLLFLASALLYFVVKFQHPGKPTIRKKKIRWFFSKESLKISVRISLIASFIAFIIFWLAMSGLSFLCTPILPGAFIGVFRYLDILLNK